MFVGSKDLGFIIFCILSELCRHPSSFLETHPPTYFQLHLFLPSNLDIFVWPAPWYFSISLSVIYIYIYVYSKLPIKYDGQAGDTGLHPAPPHFGSGFGSGPILLPPPPASSGLGPLPAYGSGSDPLPFSGLGPGLLPLPSGLDPFPPSPLPIWVRVHSPPSPCRATPMKESLGSDCLMTWPSQSPSHHEWGPSRAKLCINETPVAHPGAWHGGAGRSHGPPLCAWGKGRPQLWVSLSFCSVSHCHCFDSSTAPCAPLSGPPHGGTHMMPGGAGWSSRSGW